MTAVERFVLVAQADTDTGAENVEAVPAGPDEQGETVGPDTGTEVEHGAAGEADAHAEPAIPEEVWLFVALAILFAMIYRPVRRAVLGALDQRAARIASQLDEAKRLREEAQAALAGFQRRQRDAMAEAEEIIAHARHEAERLRSDAAKHLEEALKRREGMAMDRIAQAEAQAMAEVRNMAVDVAITASRRLIADQLDSKRHAGLVDGAIADLSKKLH